MIIGKAVNLRVRPVQSVDLCYPVDGLISRQPAALLGSPVGALNIEGLYLVLLDRVQGDDSRLAWNSEKIYNFLQSAAPPGGDHLSHLRNGPAAAELDSAVMMRQNAYLTSYSPDILARVRKVYYDDHEYPEAVRYRLMADLENDVSKLHQGLTRAYKQTTLPWGKYDDVVKAARSQYDNRGNQYSGSDVVEGKFEGFSETTSWGYEFRYPSVENDLRYHQSRAAIRQEFLNAWRMAEMCRYEDTTFSNEVAVMDQRIFALQAAYVDTFLVSPFDGIVTGVFRAQGDYVRAGEPVLRVENDEMMYLVGTVKYRGMMRIGSKVTVTTTLFDAAGAQPTTIDGSVSAVRGHNSVAEQWDILVACANRTDAGEPILPLNYNFDFESTTVEVTAF
jgi:hypothetical protein